MSYRERRRPSGPTRLTARLVPAFQSGASSSRGESGPGPSPFCGGICRQNPAHLIWRRTTPSRGVRCRQIGGGGLGEAEAGINGLTLRLFRNQEITSSGATLATIIMRIGEVVAAFPDVLLIILIAATLRPRVLDWARDFELSTGISGIVSSGVVPADSVRSARSGTTGDAPV